MNKQIIALSVGPVQGFISQARKTQDLNAGSEILSTLVKSVCEKFRGQMELVFPDENSDSMPNRLIAIYSEEKSVAEFGEELESFIQKQFLNMAMEAKNYFLNDSVNSIVPRDFDKTIFNKSFEQQIKRMLEISWIAIPFKEEIYKENYLESERLLGATKNTKMFHQYANYYFEDKNFQSHEFGERGIKCSICGERNTLFYKEKNRHIGEKLEKQKAIQSKHTLIRKGEGLCAVCFTKRYYYWGKDKSFLSTGGIAILNALNKMKGYQEGLIQLKGSGSDFYLSIDEPKKGLQKFDPAILLEKSLKEEILEEYRWGSERRDTEGRESVKKEEDLSEGTRNSIESFRKKMESQRKLSPYYSVIAFDGDSMGEWLAGEHLEPAENQENTSKQLKEFHKELTEKLSQFAQKARKLVEGTPEKEGASNEEKNIMRGSVVYAGGEDFLGFINNEYLLDVLKELKELFNKEVNQPIKKQFETKKDLTFTAGVAIVHNKYLLSRAIKDALEMEKKAKEIDGKNAVGIAYLKRSGEKREVLIPWEDKENNSTSISEALETVMQAIKSGDFSSSFAYRLEGVLRILPEEKNEIQKKITSLEIKRLVERAFNAEKDSLREKEKKVDILYNAILELQEILYRKDRNSVIRRPNESLVNILMVLKTLVKDVHNVN